MKNPKKLPIRFFIFLFYPIAILINIIFIICEREGDYENEIYND